MIAYTLEHLFSYTATLGAPPEVIGPVPEGIKVNFYVTGGEVTGPKVRGKVRPVGADWLTLRRDGVAILDVRATLETTDGALILITYPGILDLGEDGYDRFLRGDLPPASQIRTSPRLFTSHPDYVWLNRLHCLGVGQTDLPNNRVAYDVYAVR
ncbi:MAG: DUF3237 domain-containing protein [Bryobacteraceae bacterium]|nr:DUF3237 domain-containing protein [Bryobacteraceae bacterium]